MRTKVVFPVAAVICALFVSLAAAQDFQRDYDLPAGAAINIRNIAGNINVTGYDGASIIVLAYKQGRDRDRVAIVDTSDGDSLDIYVEYPRNRSTEASVEFDIRVPRSLDYDFENISSVSGDVSIASARGWLHSQSVSGGIHITDFMGDVNGSSVSGDVFVEIPRNIGAVKMTFASISGDVLVHAPADLDAWVELSTISGSVWTSFPIKFSGRWPFDHKSARGRVGNGTASLRMSSISGGVCLLADR